MRRNNARRVCLQVLRVLNCTCCANNWHVAYLRVEKWKFEPLHHSLKRSPNRPFVTQTYRRTFIAELPWPSLRILVVSPPGTDVSCLHTKESAHNRNSQTNCGHCKIPD